MPAAVVFKFREKIEKRINEVEAIDRRHQTMLGLVEEATKHREDAAKF